MTSASSGLDPVHRSRVGDDRAHEPRERVAHLRHRDRDLALGGLDPAGPVAISSSMARWKRSPRGAISRDEEREGQQVIKHLPTHAWRYLTAPSRIA